MFLSSIEGIKSPGAMALAAGTTALIILILALGGSFFLPEPKPEDAAE